MKRAEHAQKILILLKAYEENLKTQREYHEKLLQQFTEQNQAIKRKVHQLGEQRKALNWKEKKRLLFCPLLILIASLGIALCAVALSSSFVYFPVLIDLIINTLFGPSLCFLVGISLGIKLIVECLKSLFHVRAVVAACETNMAETLNLLMENGTSINEQEKMLDQIQKDLENLQTTLVSWEALSDDAAPENMPTIEEESQSLHISELERLSTNTNAFFSFQDSKQIAQGCTEQDKSYDEPLSSPAV